MICTQATASRSSRPTKSPDCIAALNWSKSESNHCVCEASIQRDAMAPFSRRGLAERTEVVSSQSSSSMISAPSLPCTEYTTLRTPAVQVRKQCAYPVGKVSTARSEEHTSELQSQSNLVCRLLL